MNSVLISPTAAHHIKPKLFFSHLHVPKLGGHHCRSYNR